jgi:hypothetical protein
MPNKESSDAVTAEILCNNLLRSFSVQAWKKIEETKKKAVEIMQVRQRNKETKSFKSEFTAQREAEDRERAERNAANRDNQKAAVRFNKETHVNRNVDEAERLKQERQQH